MNIFALIGRAVLSLLAAIGRLAIFTGSALAAVVSPPVYGRLFLQQVMRIGYFSLPVVGLTAFFTGGVLALQIYLGGNRYGAESIVPQIVVLGITRELGPVIAGLMVAGRVAAAIAAEIGTMKVTEQIDALTTLATNPVKYLVVPRILAAVVTMPILTAVGDSIGVFGGYIVATENLGFTGSTYLKNTVDFATNSDINSGLIKAAVFGFIIALMGCFNGFHSRGGAQGVGAATTNAVVSSCILILAADFVLTAVLFHT
ncbi:MAG: ABC transporter permease [Alphaproteobacteria bacterium 64-11]|nr:ABC transporter permease [Alphaproteobacteria bacterium]OJU10536.1 MAG: ABC transporter permease [Alphaproteobacteria bacterium 64-11]